MKYRGHRLAAKLGAKKLFFLVAGLLTFFYQTKSGIVYPHTGEEFLNSDTTYYDNGFITYYWDDTECRSLWVLTGFELWSPGARGVIMLLALCYLFLGIAIIADVFMEAIQVVTEKTKTINRGGKMVQVKFWNETIANLSLMALGSSAPEILLSVLETVQNLGEEAGELGPATIVGSAAFNLLCISGVCVVSIPDGQIKAVKGVPVFIVTSVSSIFAYLWLYITLEVNSKKVIEIWEGVLTFCFFIILLLASYAADKNLCRRRKTPQGEDEAEMDEGEKLTPEVFKNILSIEKKKAAGELNEAAGVKEETPHQNFANLNEALKKMNIDNMYDLTPKQMAQLIRDQNIIAKIKYRKSLMRPEKNVYNKIQHVDEKAIQKEGSELQRIHAADGNEQCGFKSPEYAVIESAGHVELTVRKKLPGAEFQVGFRTRDGAAVAGEDYHTKEGILNFKSGVDELKIEVQIIDDNQYEADEDFYVELFDPSTKAVLRGSDTVATVIIIDDDQPGSLEFQSRHTTVIENQMYAQVVVARTNGSDGVVNIAYRTEECGKEASGAQQAALAGEDYIHQEGTLTFGNGEVRKVISIKIVPKHMLERDQIFKVVLHKPTGGATLSRKSQCIVEVVNDAAYASFIGKVEKALEAAESGEDETWGDQFKNAILFEVPTDEEGNPQPVGFLPYFLHFASMGWAVLFACVPPRKWGGGWPAFGIALCFIGVVTAVVGDYATLLGCAVGLKDGVTAITFVALGTSLPDTFASKQAALEEEFADAAIGNITGSNSVNVFLGLGLPWIIASVYHDQTGDTGGEYRVPAKGLGFSVAVFTVVAIICLGVLCLRRIKLGGELGGEKRTKWMTFAFFVFMWFIYVILSSLKTYEKI